MKPSLKKSTLAALVAINGIGLAGCVRLSLPAPPEARAAQSADVGAHLTNYGEAVVPANGSISVWGDAFSGEASPHGRQPQTANFAAALGARVRVNVIDQMRRGETVTDGLARFKQAEIGNLVVICYGYGDAETGVVDHFGPSLKAMIEAAHARGAAVIVLMEPALSLPTPKNDRGNSALASKPTQSQIVLGLQINAQDLAVGLGAGVLDAPTMLSRAGLGPSTTQTQSAGAVHAMANMVATYVKIAPAV